MDWQRILYSLPGIIIGFTVHEYCHALAAFKLGDSSVREDGRLTLDPLRHIDPIGLLFIVFAGFGWAKPVHYYPEMLKHPKRDGAIIAAAGPLSNLALGIFFTLIIKLISMLPVSNGEADHVFRYIITILFYWAAVNLGLFVFNLIPLPPLDGSHIFLAGLNLRPETEYTIMRIGSMALFLILIIQSMTPLNILPIGRAVQWIIRFILNF